METITDKELNDMIGWLNDNANSNAFQINNGMSRELKIKAIKSTYKMIDEELIQLMPIWLKNIFKKLI